MGQINLTLPTAGQTLNSVADPEIVTAFQTLQAWANGNIDSSNLTAGAVNFDRLSSSAVTQLMGTQLAGALQVGVMGNVASTGITATVAATTRVLTLSNFPTNDVIWFKNAAGVLIEGTLATVPGTLAFNTFANSSWAYVSVDAVLPTTAGGACTYTTTQSAAQTSANNAANAPTAVAAGNVRVWDGIAATDGSGNYSLTTDTVTGVNHVGASTGRDRRPFARGILRQVGTAGSNVTNGSGSVLQGSIQAECSGMPTRITFAGNTNASTSGIEALYTLQDGATTLATAVYYCANGNENYGTTYTHWFTPAAGNHTFNLYGQYGPGGPGGGTSVNLLASGRLVVEEQIRPFV